MQTLAYLNELRMQVSMFKNNFFHQPAEAIQFVSCEHVMSLDDVIDEITRTPLLDRFARRLSRLENRVEFLFHDQRIDAGLLTCLRKVDAPATTKVDLEFLEHSGRSV